MKWENWREVLERCGFRTCGTGSIPTYGPWGIDIRGRDEMWQYHARLLHGHMPGFALAVRTGDSEDAAFSALLNASLCTGHVMVYQLIGAGNYSVESDESRRVVRALIQAHGEEVV